MSYLPVLESSGVLLLLLEASLKGSLVLAAAGLMTSLLRKSPAAVRHMIWTTALVAVAVLPAIVAFAPKYDVGVLPAQILTEDSRSKESDEGSRELPAIVPESIPEGAEAAEISRADKSELRTVAPVESRTRPGVGREAAEPARGGFPGTGVDWRVGLLLLWAGGMLVVGLRYVIGWIALRRIRKQSEPVADVRFRLNAIKVARAMGLTRRVSFVWGASNGMPLTWGCLLPTVLLPDGARKWKTDKLLAVLRHELAHIKRRDCLIQSLVYIVCAVYWFNPLVWIAAAHSRREREIACDDYVIQAGTRGSEYADHLLEIARSLRTPGMSGVSTIAMARPSELEGRLMAILSADRHRDGNTRVGMFATMGLLAAIAFPIATLRPVPTDTAAEIESVAAKPVDIEESVDEPVDGVRNERTNRRDREVETRSPLSDPEATSFAEQSIVKPAPVPDATREYIEQANELMEKAARTLESIERLEPTVSAWQAEFGQGLTEAITPLILDEIIADPDTIPLAQIRRLKVAGVDVQYIEELASVGLGHLTINQLVSLAHAGVDAEYVLEMRGAGYADLNPDELSRLAFASVDPGDIAVWAELGYRELTADELIRLAHADVDAEFVLAMARFGYRDLGPNDLARMSHADVDPAFIAEMIRAGYSGLSADELIRLGHADIDAEFIRRMSEYGLTNLSAEDLIRLGHADVDARYIEAMRWSGYTDLSVDDLIRMSHADVDPLFVQDLASAGYQDLSPDELIRLGHAGVSSEYVSELQQAGLKNVAVDDLVRLAHADVDAEYLKEVEQLGFEMDDVDKIVRLKYMEIDLDYVKRMRNTVE